MIESGKKHAFLLSLALLIALFLSTGCSVPLGTGEAVAVGTGGEDTTLGAVYQKYLDVPAYRQARSTWCWAAADLMIWDYFGLSPHLYQSDIVRMVVGEVRDTPEGVSPGPFMVDNGIDYTLVYSTISKSDLASSINRGRPLLVRTTNLDGTGAHIMVIRGYYWYVSGNISYMAVAVIDPANGQRVSYVYDYLVQSSTRKWTHTWKEIHH